MMFTFSFDSSFIEVQGSYKKSLPFNLSNFNLQVCFLFYYYIFKKSTEKCLCYEYQPNVLGSFLKVAESSLRTVG